LSLYFLIDSNNFPIGKKNSSLIFISSFNSALYDELNGTEQAYFSGFLFGLIIKSMILFINRENKVIIIFFFICFYFICYF
jgi:hypothetical protein